MEATPDSEDREHRYAQDALVWWVNGSLDPAARARMQAHLGHCAECRAALRFEERLATQIRGADEVLSFAPQGGYAKLKTRIALARDDAATSPVAPAPRPAPSLRRTLQLQAAAIAVLALTVGWLVMRPSPAPYETHTRDTGNPAVSGPQLQIVFARDLPVATARARLADLGARVLEGPSAAGVYRIVLDPGTDAEAVAAALAREPDVRFTAVLAP